MSWQIAINDLKEIESIPDEQLKSISRDNPEYGTDAIFAFDLAKARGLVSCSLCGGRTPSPYGGADTITISIVGFDSDKVGHAVGHNFYSEMIRTITHTADELDWDNE